MPCVESAVLRPHSVFIAPCEGIPIHEGFIDNALNAFTSWAGGARSPFHSVFYTSSSYPPGPCGQFAGHQQAVYLVPPEIFYDDLIYSSPEGYDPNQINVDLK